MNNDTREQIYLRDRKELTPAQARRLRRKGNQATSERVSTGLPRFARLRRRFDRKDTRQVTQLARNLLTQTLMRKRYQDHAPKATSKNQQRRRVGRG